MGRKVYFLLVLNLVIALLGSGVAGSGAAFAATRTRKVCSATAAARTARCLASIETDSGGVVPLSSSTPAGYGPTNFKAAYGVHGSAITHIGIVTAYDAPHIVQDLDTFSKAYGLSVPVACTASMKTGCFEKVSQRGTTVYPTTDSSWAIEASMDVETAHGICPQCQISLIEASSSSMDNFASAVDEAVARGSKVVSNSYGGPESSGEAAYDAHYHRTGVAMIVSSGDNGYGTSYPAASPNVMAVGGTSLKMSGSRVTSETAWSGAGSGCSLYEYKPFWQKDKKCAMRSLADISADADPSTGAAIYDSYPNSGRSGWFTVGGTSLAAPLVAGIIAASGDTANQPASIYTSTAAIRDIVGGNNGSCTSYLCNATNGYDGPTGLGVLNRL